MVSRVNFGFDLATGEAAFNELEAIELALGAGNYYSTDRNNAMEGSYPSSAAFSSPAAVLACQLEAAPAAKEASGDQHVAAAPPGAPVPSLAADPPPARLPALPWVCGVPTQLAARQVALRQPGASVAEHQRLPAPGARLTLVRQRRQPGLGAHLRIGTSLGAEYNRTGLQSR